VASFQCEENASHTAESTRASRQKGSLINGKEKEKHA
jgi:hypothetical protein